MGWEKLIHWVPLLIILWFSPNIADKIAGSENLYGFIIVMFLIIILVILLGFFLSKMIGKIKQRKENKH